MLRSVLLASLLVAGCLSAQAEIVQYQSHSGRRFFTNVNANPPKQPMSHARTPIAKAPGQTLRLIQELAHQYRIEARLIQAVIKVESNFNPRAVSSAGALGLMQLMPATVKRFDVADPFNPRANIEGGIRYLQYLRRLFPNDLRRVLAAYNAGEHAVYRYNGIPPYPETQRYIKRVMAFYGPSPAPKKMYRFRQANGSILLTDMPR